MAIKNLNLVILIGRLTVDPELKTTANGKELVRCSIATNYSWKSATGEWQEGVDFHNIVAWGSVATQLAEQMHKGEMVCVKGKLQMNKWEDKEGQTHKNVEIVVQDVVKADSKAGKKYRETYMPQRAENKSEEE